MKSTSTTPEALRASEQDGVRLADAHRRAEELRMLLDVGRAITGTLDLEEVLDVSAGILAELVDASNSFIMLHDERNDELRGAGCSNLGWREAFRHVRLPLSGPSIAAQAVRERAPVAVDDVSVTIHARSVRTWMYGEKSLLAVPLLVRDSPIGCIIVDDVRVPRAWGEAEIERVTLIAHQIAIAIANARLYDDLRRTYAKVAQAQEALVKRERLAALGELAAVVAHEVRNPLGVMFNSLASLSRLVPLKGDAKVLFDIVGEEAERLDRIVRDLLDFARPNPPSLATRPLGPLLAEALEATTRDASQVRGVLEVDPELHEIPLDERMIRQALLNLFSNGVQAMPKGGELKVAARLVSEDDEPWVRVDVADRGGGIAPEFAERIFQPFFTTKATGTGLGLAVVKRVIEGHRGRIDFESTPGEGTTFTLLLPAREEDR
ncbi:MAG TPA: ATP-binding protein [Vulgatibacter sp.]|nr:ATP-binding protein [Vulgatibacter sp.]